MFVSISFSVVIFIDINRELSRFEVFQNIRRERLESEFGQLPTHPLTSAVDREIISEARGRLIANLLLLNTLILAISGGAAYFLAGRTLGPIKKMLDDQAQFIGDASHELKTPLTALRSEIEVYLRSKTHSVEEADEILKSNLEEVVRLQNLSDSLMILTSFERTNIQNVSMEMLDLKQIVSFVIKRVQPLAKDKNIVITDKSKKVELFGNEKSLIELFVILLDNAIKYSDRGKKVVISSVNDEKYVSVKVTDQGPGIEEADTERIFGRFYRADKSRTSTDKVGYGLGLSIAKEIVKLHNGNISVKSKVGKGSEFIVDLLLK